MDKQVLKERIKKLIYEMLEEDESVSDDAGPYSTPKAFKKKNEIKTTGSANGPKGRRFIPDETILPGTLRPGNFKLLVNGQNVFLFISPLAKLGLEAITRGRTNRDTQAELPRLARLFQEKMPQMTRGLIKKSIKTSKINKIGDQDWIPVEVEIKGINPDNNDIILKVPSVFNPEDTQDTIQNAKYEAIGKLIEAELLKEGYSQFKNEIKYRTQNEQLHKAIKEVKYKLKEIDRLVEYTTRMKTELSEGPEGLKYWKATENAVSQISEMLGHLSNKIKNLNQ